MRPAAVLGLFTREHIAARILAGGVTLIGCAGPEAPAPPPPVEVVAGVPLKKAIVEWDEYVGRLDAVDFVEVRSRVGGYLMSIHFDEGQVVAAGELLFVIDPRPYQAEVSRAEASVAEAQARIREMQAVLFQAEANKRAAESRLDLANRQLERSAALLPTRAISQDEYDVQASRTTQAEAEVEASGAEVESAKAAVQTAKSTVATSLARLEIAKLNLEYTKIYAPIAGRMSRRLVTEGNLISGGAEQSTLLTTIVSQDPIHCYFDADEQAFLKYTRLAREGTRASSRDVKNPVFVALADEPKGFPHAGHMDFVDNRLDPDTGTMRGRAILANEDLSLTPGLFVRLRLPGSGRYEAILIPDYAIGMDQSEKFVFVVEDGAVRRQAVETGPLVHGLRVIRSGLEGDESIVLRGLQRVRSGAKVAAKTEEIVLRDDEGLPDDYEPVPREKWLRRRQSEATAAKPPTTVARDEAAGQPESPAADRGDPQESP